TGFGKHLSSEFHVCSLKPHDKRNLYSNLAGRGHNTACNRIAFHNTAKYVYKHRLYILVPEDHLKGLRYLLSARATAHIQKVSRLASVVFNNVHRSHSKACAVYQASNISIELYIAETPFLCLKLRWVFFI